MAGCKRGGIYGGRNTSRVSMAFALSSILKLMRCERIAQAEAGVRKLTRHSPTTAGHGQRYSYFCSIPRAAQLARLARGEKSAVSRNTLAITSPAIARCIRSHVSWLAKGAPTPVVQFFSACSSPSDRNARARYASYGWNRSQRSRRVN